MDKLCKDDHYYRWLGDRGKIYVKLSEEKWLFVENGQLFLGKVLNSAINRKELRWGFSLNWLELPNSVEYFKANDYVSKLTLEECFDLLGNIYPNSSVGEYPIIQRFYSEKSSDWRVSVNDYWGDRSQIEYFSIEGSSILNCMRGAVIMCIVRGIIPLPECVKEK